MPDNNTELIKAKSNYEQTVEHLFLVIDVQSDCNNMVLMGLEIFN